MRTCRLSLFQRIGVEVSLMSLGSIVIYLKPPVWGRIPDTEFVLAASVVTTGGFAMAGDLLCAMCAAVCLPR